MRARLARTVAVSSVIALAAACSSEGSGDETPAPDDTSASASESQPATGDGTTPEEPLPADETVALEDWEITVGEVNRDATDEILEASVENKPPKDGEQYVLAGIEATRLNAEDGIRDFDFQSIEVQVMDTDREEYGGITGQCGEVPDNIYDVSDIAEGDTVTGNVCVPVAASKLDGAVWMFQAPDGDPVFVLLA